MKRTAVINVVGLSSSLLGPAMPRLSEFARRGTLSKIAPAFPAVTCTAQSNYLTGKQPCEHGIVGNGWYHRELAEVQFWKQSNQLVRAPKIWEEARHWHPEFTCAKLFWWYNMYASVDYSITPRPQYPADGRKVFDIYAWPYSIRDEIKRELGDFPFPGFWGPAAGVAAGPFASDAASRWIAEASKWIERKFEPTLSLVYLPHLDYNLQRLGPAHPGISRDVRQIDEITGELVDYLESRSVQVVLLSEYGITPVDRPIHLNRLFRERGWLAVKDEQGLEVLDCGASRVFAVADHQIAHVYLNDRSVEKEVRPLLESVEGVEEVLDESGKAAAGLNHERAGDFVTVAAERAWFTYYYWLDDRVAPDFARTVDIHRKPGYDPVELFLDPGQQWIKLKIARRLLEKKLGFRMLMDVIPLDASLVKGSHGRKTTKASDQPILITPRQFELSGAQVDSTEVGGILLKAMGLR